MARLLIAWSLLCVGHCRGGWPGAALAALVPAV